jgi:hypothetical protein
MEYSMALLELMELMETEMETLGFLPFLAPF